MDVYLLRVGKGLKGPASMHGGFFLGEKALYFLCTCVGTWDSGKYEEFGPIGRALAEYRNTGTVPAIDEGALATQVSATPNSEAIGPDQIELISRSMWSGSKILYGGGQKLVIWNPGFAGRFRDRTREWAQGKGVKTKGL